MSQILGVLGFCFVLFFILLKNIIGYQPRALHMIDKYSILYAQIPCVFIW